MEPCGKTLKLLKRNGNFFETWCYDEEKEYLVSQDDVLYLSMYGEIKYGVLYGVWDCHNSATMAAGIPLLSLKRPSEDIIKSILVA